MKLLTDTFSQIYNRYGSGKFIFSSILIYPNFFKVFYSPEKFSFLMNQSRIFFIPENENSSTEKNEILYLFDSLDEVEEILKETKISLFGRIKKYFSSDFAESVYSFFGQDLFLKNVFGSQNIPDFFKFSEVEISIRRKIYFEDLFEISTRRAVVNVPEFFETKIPFSFFVYVKKNLIPAFSNFIYVRFDVIREIIELLINSFFDYILSVLPNNNLARLVRDFYETNFSDSGVTDKFLFLSFFSDFVSIFESCIYDKLIQNYELSEFLNLGLVETEISFFDEINSKYILNYSIDLFPVVFSIFENYKYSPVVYFTFLRYIVYVYTLYYSVGETIYSGLGDYVQTESQKEIYDIDLSVYHEAIESLDKSYDIENFSQKIRNLFVRDFVKTVFSNPEYFGLFDIEAYGELDEIIGALYYADSSSFIDSGIKEQLDSLLSEFEVPAEMRAPTMNLIFELYSYPSQFTDYSYVWIYNNMLEGLLNKIEEGGS